jgi:hypothetical protein
VNGATVVDGVAYPLLWASADGTLSILLHHHVLIDIALDKSVRLAVPGKMSVS